MSDAYVMTLRVMNKMGQSLNEKLQQENKQLREEVAKLKIELNQWENECDVRRWPQERY